MLCPSSVLLAFLLVGGIVGSETPEQSLARSTNNWKVIIGNYGSILGRLKEKGYNSDEVRSFGEYAISAFKTCFDKRLNNYPKKDQVEATINESMATFPDGDWNIKLVDNVKNVIEESEANKTKVVLTMTNIFGSMICWRKAMEDRAVELKGAEYYKCINHEYQGLIRGWNGQCVENTKAGTTGDTAEPTKMPPFWTMCKPVVNGTEIDCTKYKEAA